MMTFASDSVFRFTSLCRASVSVPASNWFSLDCVFLMISVSNFVVFSWESLRHTITTFCSWLSVLFDPLQFVALHSTYHYQIDLLWIVSFWWFLFPVLDVGRKILWQTMITFCSWLFVHFVSFRLTSFQSMSRIRLLLRRLSHPLRFLFLVSWCA